MATSLNLARLAFLGDIKGDFDMAFGTLRSMRFKFGPEGCKYTVFVCGDFFGDIPPVCQEYIDGTKRVPLPLYILGATCEGQAELYSRITGEICEVMPNVTYLGKFGVVTTVEGLNIAYLSGVEGSKSNSWTFTSETVIELIEKCSQYRKIDVLLTYQWPLGVDMNVPGCKITPKSPSKLIALLVASVKPQLHFAAKEQMCFSWPYRAIGKKYTNIFNGITSLERTYQGKWLYKIKIPVSDPTIHLRTTMSMPFTEFLNSQGQSKLLPSYDNESKKQWNVGLHYDRKPCWFCRFITNSDRSLIITETDHIFLILTDGPVADGQVTISTKKHLPKVTYEVEQDMKKYLDSLARYYSSLDKALVWFERCFRSSHVLVHAIPLPYDIVARGFVDKHIAELTVQHRVQARLFKIDKVVNLRRNISISCLYYFYFQIGNDRGYLIDLPKGSEFPVNFGRKVIARALGVPEREYWANCTIDKRALADKTTLFRQTFAQYISP